MNSKHYKHYHFKTENMNPIVKGVFTFQDGTTQELDVAAIAAAAVPTAATVKTGVDAAIDAAFAPVPIEAPINTPAA